MAAPLVSFVVPCYGLARYLTECVGTILSQSYPHLEVLIIDDASPDDTEDVSRRIIAQHPERRLRFVRHATNLGHLRSYNDGIRLSSGEYVWILSPDDRLRSREVIRRYVDLMEARPDVGYAFCPGHRIHEDSDQGLHRHSLYGVHDRVVSGRSFVMDLIDNRFELLSPAVLIRKSCYTDITQFPEDLPHRGDTFVWAMIAMQRSVAYFAEAMVDYRVHDASMMSTMARERPEAMIADDVAVLWRIRSQAERRGLSRIARRCERAIARYYARALAGMRVRGATVTLSIPELEDSLGRYEPDDARRAVMRCSVLSGYGDRLYWAGRIPEAQAAYAGARRACGGSLTRRRAYVLAKLGLAHSGGAGAFVRKWLGRARRWVGAAGGA